MESDAIRTGSVLCASGRARNASARPTKRGSEWRGSVHFPPILIRAASPVKTSLTVLTFVMLLLVPQAIPSLKNYMSIEPKSAVAVLNFSLKPATMEPLIDPLASPANLSHTLNQRLLEKAPTNLSDPTHVLDH